MKYPKKKRESPKRVFSEEHRNNMRKAAKGKKLTEEHKRKISQTLKGRMFSEETRKKISKAKKGVKTGPVSEEALLNMSKAQKGKNNSFYGKKHSGKTLMHMRKIKIGKNNPNWQGGISYEPYCPAFNETVKEYIRDKYMNMCFLCSKTEKENGRKLAVHHIDYNKEQGCNQHEWRLVPLCISCNVKANTNRDMWERRIKIFLDII